MKKKKIYVFGYENRNCTDRLYLCEFHSRKTNLRGMDTSRKWRNGCIYIERKICILCYFYRIIQVVVFNLIFSYFLEDFFTINTYIYISHKVLYIYII